ncbi:MAG: WYL domain-containing protein [Cytophagaceae bacterium]|nr:WYL domain-containing protein [Gemmatimonadaceae bacterium]
MSKLQRWIDLVAELLSRRVPAPFEELARGVPEYHEKLRRAESEDGTKRRRAIDSLKRTFERDKDELRQLGFPLQSVKDDDGVESLYQLKPNDFYLPYLCLAMPGRNTGPRKVDKWGYHALATLSFTADELQAVVEGATTLRTLGDPLLVMAASGALRKLAVDLPVGAASLPDDVPRRMPVRARPDIATFNRLGDAVQRRKVATFTYRTMATGSVESRDVEPYGLFFVNGHWYLAGHDRQRGARRNFRLSRIDDAALPNDSVKGPDFVVPRTFDIRELARSRHAWELGDAEALVAIVEFRDDSGPAMAARTLGDRVDGQPTQRRFAVRRPDAFVRWVLSFAGSVMPHSPAPVIDALAAVLRATRALYDRPAHPAEASKQSATAVLPDDTWNSATAAGQLSRILHAIPRISGDRPERLSRLAEALDTDVDTLRRDLFALGDRYDVPGGFVEGVRLYLEADRVSADTNHFRRPMRLTVAELCALELGLAVLQSRRPPDERAPVAAARERLRKVITKLPNDPMPGLLPDLAIAEDAPAPALDVLRTSIAARHKLRLSYRRSGSSASSERTIHPYGLVHSNGMLYIVAWCEVARDVRTFRLDRIQSLDATPDTFSRDDGIELDSLLGAHRALMKEDQHAVMRVRYSPQVARWVAEREGRELAADGSLVIDHPLADIEWGLRHVLQYGAEAEVLAPPSMREAVKARVDAMLAAVAGRGESSRGNETMEPGTG